MDAMFDQTSYEDILFPSFYASLADSHGLITLHLSSAMLKALAETEFGSLP